MLYEVTHHKQPPRCLAGSRQGHAGGTWKGEGGETRGTARGRTPDTRACLACVLGGGQAGAVQYTVTHHKQPPLLAGSRQGLSACRVQSMDVGCGCDAGHTTHTQGAQGKKITAPCGGACGRRTSFPMPWRHEARHLGRTHAEHCATTASTARGGAVDMQGERGNTQWESRGGPSWRSSLLVGDEQALLQALGKKARSGR